MNDAQRQARHLRYVHLSPEVRVDVADVLRRAPLHGAGRRTKRVAASLVVTRAAPAIRPRSRGATLAGQMPLPDNPFWATLAIVALCALNAATAILEVVVGRPSWLRRLLNLRGRVPATPRDWRLHGAVMSLASGGVMLLTIGQGLTVGSLLPWGRCAVSPWSVCIQRSGGDCLAI